MELLLCDGVTITLNEFSRWSFIVHINVTPELRGSFANKIFAGVADKILAETGKTKLITIIPKSLRHVLLFGYQLGFVKEGMLTNFSEDKREDSIILVYNKKGE